MATIHEESTTTIESESPKTADQGSTELAKRHILLTLSGSTLKRLDDLVDRTGYDVAGVIATALTLYQMSLDAVEEGKRVGIVDDDREIDTEFTGFHKNDPTVE
jgi:hypothetical protein